MTRTTFLTSAFLVVAFAAAGAADDAIGLLPEEKEPVAVQADERNPFGRRAPKAPEAPTEETETEETQIRSVIEGLTVTGIVQGAGGAKVLIGSFALEEGQEMPPVIPGQTEKLRVVSLADGRLELGFVEKDGTTETRRIRVPMDLTPAVRFALGNKNPKPADESAPPVEFGGVVRKDEPAPAQ